MRILLLNDTVDVHGGSNSACIRILNSLAPFCNELTWFGVERNSQLTKEKLLHENIKIHPVKSHKKNPFNQLYDFRYKSELHSFLKQNNIDLALICNMHNGLSISIIDAIKKIKVKTVFYPFDNWLWCERRYNFNNNFNKKGACRICYKKTSFKLVKFNCGGNVKSLLKYTFRKVFTEKKLKKLNAYIAPSQYFKELFIQRGIKNYYQTLYPVPIDENTKELSYSDYILYFGTEVAAKGIDYLIHLWTKFNDLPLLKIVLPNANPTLKKTVANLNIEIVENVTRFTGLEDYVLKAKFVIIPSLWDTPGEQVLFESWSYKKAVVISNHGFHNELTSEENCFIFNSDNMDDCRRVILMAWQSTKLKDVGLSGYKYLVEKQNKWAVRFMDFLNQVYESN